MRNAIDTRPNTLNRLDEAEAYRENARRNRAAADTRPVILARDPEPKPRPVTETERQFLSYLATESRKYSGNHYGSPIYRDTNGVLQAMSEETQRVLFYSPRTIPGWESVRDDDYSDRMAAEYESEDAPETPLSRASAADEPEPAPWEGVDPKKLREWVRENNESEQTFIETPWGSYDPDLTHFRFLREYNVWFPKSGKYDRQYGAPIMAVGSIRIYRIDRLTVGMHCVKCDALSKWEFPYVTVGSKEWHKAMDEFIARAEKVFTHGKEHGSKGHRQYVASKQPLFFESDIEEYKAMGFANITLEYLNA